MNERFDFPLLDASGPEECDYLLDHLVQLLCLSLEGARSGDEGGSWYKLTVKGWQQVEAFGAAGVPGRCFVAMWFNPEIEEAFTKGIVPAITDCGFRPIRIDREQHNEKICDRIIAEVRRSQFLVADFTGHRGGVYFEAGFALGLGRPVIWTCRKDHLERAHFDTRQYNHIEWSTPEELRDRLKNRILATIPGAAQQQ